MAITSSRGGSRRRGRLWIGLRVAVPCAVGLLCGLLWLAPRASALAALPSAGFAIALGCAVALRIRPPSTPGCVPTASASLRWQWLFLSLALLGTCSYVAAQALSAGKAWACATGCFGVAAGLSAMIVTSLDDVRWTTSRDQRYCMIVTPWLAALAQGLLGSWLLVRGKATGLVVAEDQRLLSLVIVIVVLELFVFLRWHGSTSRGIQGDQLVFRDRQRLFGRLVNLRAWGGCIASDALIVLTMTNEGGWFAYLAWALLLLGEGTWYMLLLSLMDRS